MGAKAGKPKQIQMEREVERMDIRSNSTVLSIHDRAAEISILGSHNRITIHPVSDSSLHSLTVEGSSNTVRLERSTHLVDILGADNSVTVAKGTAVERMRIQGEVVRWVAGKKDMEERGTEDGL